MGTPTDLGFYSKTLNCGNSHGFGILQLDFEKPYAEFSRMNS
ncbi:hypothetical protein LEP1GSC067_3855 [Leptospira interrogans serovar Lora str. TE 1992]|uniref:Uncharacterized protein n=1 Tax=Leptospira interrogans serovar Lora str. TE 1992 TaxID=1193028 RepID=M3EWC3_LEPIR|nr:hypothetical protein LEP1GSC067_3855 [Leptospira interrogans serovar Lora str. TE 1992]EMN10025.1 hypothetical protein LEP1GSC053_3842 [Leptospira interrogans serovar Muenchen str. Brem 129]